jgi:hypothetical protein
MWTVSRLRALGATEDDLAPEIIRQQERVIVADKAGVDREVLNGALYAVVLRDVVTALNSPATKPDHQVRYRKANQYLLRDYGLDAGVVLDASYSFIKCVQK